MLWLDNERDFLPLRYLHQTSQKPVIQIDYLEWIRLASEWLPTEWRRAYLNPDRETINQSGLAVVHTHLLNHPINANEFTLEFPVGTWVEDARDRKNRQKYIVRDQGQKREITERELSDGATYEQLLNTETGMALSYRSSSGGTWHSTIIQAAGVLLIICLGLAIWHLRWRKRTPPTSA
jgi:hypothetical protein